MKQFIMINGAMGVGKSCICKALNQRLMNSVWLDGDWCMMMNPLNFTREITMMFLDNSTYLLKNFLSNPTFDYVLYSWVFPREDLLNYLVKQVQGPDFELKKITLTCSNPKLIERMEQGGRDNVTIEKSITYQQAYMSMDTIKVDTTDLSIAETLDELIKIIENQ